MNKAYIFGLGLVLIISLIPQHKPVVEISWHEPVNAQVKKLPETDFKARKKVKSKKPQIQAEKSRETVKNESGGDIQQLIVLYANKYGVSSEILLRVANCESTMGRNLINPDYTAPDGSNPSGVFQYIRSTWLSFGKQSGISNSDERMNTAKNIELTTWAFSKGYSYHWECK